MTASVLSATPGADLEAMAINAASAAAACSSLPWRGPVGAVRVSVGADGKPAMGLSASNPANGEPPRLSLLMAATADQRVTMLDVEVRGGRIGGWECTGVTGAAPCTWCRPHPNPRAHASVKPLF